jgi:CheY-like chemotaxis protein
MYQTVLAVIPARLFDGSTRPDKSNQRDYVEEVCMPGVSANVKNSQYLLVVDSNVNDRLSTCMLLLRFGKNIFTANTEEETIEFMDAALPAAVVITADMIGLALLSRIKNDLRFSDVPLIVLSASPDGALENRARKGEIAAYLRKPLNVEEFYRVVQLVIEKGPRRKIRIATNIAAEIEDGRGRSKGYVTNLSEDGLFFRSIELRPAQTRISVVLELKGRTMTLEAVVHHSTTFDEGPLKEPGMGLKFVHISPEDRGLIKAYILEKITEGMTRPSHF